MVADTSAQPSAAVADFKQLWPDETSFKSATQKYGTAPEFGRQTHTVYTPEYNHSNPNIHEEAGRDYEILLCQNNLVLQ
ncbi:MAG: hypothetical protein J2P15_00560 [Micromonosporaceae bacterium]|nr:hypothetical protein [Micromonosporaceae bacterium]